MYRLCFFTQFLFYLRSLVSFQDQVKVPEYEVEFGVQESEVVQALDLVVPVMHPGEKCLVISDPELAYGKKKLDLFFPSFLFFRFE